LVPLQSDNILDMDSLFCSIKANGSQIWFSEISRRKTRQKLCATVK
jgi:hypothetical protein